jgi:hypothetical protein
MIAPSVSFGRESYAFKEPDPPPANPLDAPSVGYTLVRPRLDVRVPIGGRFNVMNSLSALVTAVELGIDADEVQAALQSDAHADEVRAEEREAREIGVRGVPFFVLGGKYAISGAQPVEMFDKALEKAWSEAAAKPEAFAEGAACGPDGCD